MTTPINNLRKLRDGRHLTQADLAQQLGTTQQTIGRWETGKNEPNFSALRDMAIIFGTSVDDLLGHNPMSDKLETASPRYNNFDTESGFWGHVGVKLPTATHSRWYPITLEVANRIGHSMRRATRDEPWITFHTLNNRVLLVNALAVHKVWTLTDDADEAFGDWELGQLDYAGYPAEVYRCLHDYLDGGLDEAETEYSQGFKDTLAAIVAEDDWDSANVYERLLETHVHYVSGGVDSRYIDNVGPAELLEDVQLNPGLAMFAIPASDLGFHIYVPSATVVMIDMPLHLVVQHATELRQEYLQDVSQVESLAAVKKAMAVTARVKRLPGRPRKHDADASPSAAAPATIPATPPESADAGEPPPSAT